MKQSRINSHREITFAEHRQGWLDKAVCDLSALLQSHGVDFDLRVKLITESLQLAGHGDVVTIKKIRNIMRELDALAWAVEYLKRNCPPPNSP